MTAKPDIRRDASLNTGPGERREVGSHLAERDDTFKGGWNEPRRR